MVSLKLIGIEENDPRVSEVDCEQITNEACNAGDETHRYYVGNKYDSPLSAVNQFQHRVHALIQNELNMIPAKAKIFTDSAAEAFSQGGFAALPFIAKELMSSGIGTGWNTILYNERSRCIARWVLPHVCGSLLDMLCGDGSVGYQLAASGVRVTLSERDKSYDYDHDQHTLPHLPFDLLSQSGSDSVFDTVLLSTVLHHELDPERLLFLAARMARRRLIIVENCLEEDNPPSFQLLMDIFFNHCLNQTCLESPGNHKSVEEWVSCASPYGTLYALDRKESVPGIPLSHHVIVIDIEKGRLDY